MACWNGGKGSGSVPPLECNDGVPPSRGYGGGVHAISTIRPQDVTIRSDTAQSAAHS